MFNLQVFFISIAGSRIFGNGKKDLFRQILSKMFRKLMKPKYTICTVCIYIVCVISEIVASSFLITNN